MICKRMSAAQFRAKDLAPAWQRLSDLVYAPLAKQLTNVSHLIVCPDGQLGRIPFEALLHEGRFLMEQKTISYVGSGREIARLAHHPATVTTPHASLVMGDPDFDLDLGCAPASRAVAGDSPATNGLAGNS